MGDFTELCQNLPGTLVLVFHLLDRIANRSAWSLRHGRSFPRRCFEGLDVREEDLLFLPQVAAEFRIQGIEEVLHLA